MRRVEFGKVLEEMEAMSGQAGKSAAWGLVHGRPGTLLWSSTGITFMTGINGTIMKLTMRMGSSFLASRCPAVWLSNRLQSSPPPPAPHPEGGHLGCE